MASMEHVQGLESRKSKDGRPFYYNPISKVSYWPKKLDDAKRDLLTQKTQQPSATQLVPPPPPPPPPAPAPPGPPGARARPRSSSSSHACPSSSRPLPRSSSSSHACPLLPRSSSPPLPRSSSPPLPRRAVIHLPIIPL